MNRRDFLHSASVLAASAALAPSVRANTTATPRMTIALTPGSIGVTVKTQAELNDLAYRHRFESVEPRGPELAAMSAAQLAAVHADLNAKKLVWAAAGNPVDFRKDEKTFAAGLAALPKLAEGLRRAGVTRMGTWLGPAHDELTYNVNFKQHAARLRAIATILKDNGIWLGLEYVGTQLLLVGKRYPFVHTMAETRELIAAIGTGNVGLVLDTWHWWTAGDTVEDILALEAKDIISVDLNDAPAGIPKTQQKDNERELPLATGVIDIGTFLKALVKLGYAGPCRPEPFNKALNTLDNEPACAAASTALHKAMALVR